MKRGNRNFLLIVAISILFLISLNFVLAVDTNNGIWKDKNNKTLTEILNNDSLQDSYKLFVFEKVYLAKALTKEDIDLAISKKVIKEEQRKYFENSPSGLWDLIKGYSKLSFDSSTSSFNRGVGWILGANTFGGKSITVLSPYYWKSDGLKYDALGDGWRYVLGSLVTFLLIFVVLVLYTIFSSNPYDSEYFEKNMSILGTKYPWFIIIILILFPFLMGIPIINRILQVITLEFLGTHWFWRCLIFATLLFFGPIYWKKYAEYRVRTRKYKEKMEALAIKEINRAHLK